MPLILGKGQEIKIVSKNEALKQIEDAQTQLSEEEKELAKLSPEVAERRREILAAKKHRDYMAKIQKMEEDAIAQLQEAKSVDADVHVQVTDELVVQTSSAPATTITLDDVVKVSETVVEKETPDFENMTKKELDEWAEETLGLTLDRRKKKADLIETIKNNL